jgi:hypothetical protein
VRSTIESLFFCHSLDGPTGEPVDIRIVFPPDLDGDRFNHYLPTSERSS